MRCPSCQREGRAGAKFCADCGARLALACAACGTDVPDGARFCVHCGKPVGDQSPGAPARFAVPEAYTPKRLAEKILTSRSALEGERKQVTVVFADIKGSMELLAERDPEEAGRILDPVLVHMMEAVHRYEGTVNQVMGDGIMALFGAPLAHEDHAVRACYAALRMQESVARFAEDIRRREGIPVQIRVGLNSGEVVVRSIGSDLHMDYTAVGQTTHLAARMEQAATPGTVVLTRATLRLVEAYVQVKPIGPIRVKGLSEPVEAYELTGVGQARTRLQAAAARGLTRFVGRDAEMQELGQALEQAAAGHGQLGAVVGEPGVGKSRLLYEFVHSHRTRDWLVLEGGSAPYGKATPALSVIELLKAYFHVESDRDGEAIRDRVTAELRALDPALEPILTPLLALLDVPIEDAHWQELDPPERLRLTIDAVRRLLLRVSQATPLLVVFDDLQSHDSVTQMLMDSLVDSLPRARMLLLASYRPDYRHNWGSKTYYTQIRLDPLPPESAEDLLGALVSDDPELGSLKQLLIDRTEGNPFFLEESVRSLVETGALEGRRGAYRLTKALPTIQIPPTVEAVLAARIDRLRPEEKELLQCAAVVGKDVRVSLLHAIADMDEDAFRPGLQSLQAAEFLYEAGRFPEPEYTFKHALTHDVTYGGLLQDSRRRLHGRIVEALERVDGEPEQIELLAHHAFRGEAWDKAVRYLRQAGAAAAFRSAHREAGARFEQALEALEHLPKSREAIAQAIDVRFELRNSLHPLGQFDRILDHLHEAEAQATALGDQRRLGRVSSFMCQYFRVLGNLDLAIPAGERAVAIADRLGDLWLRIVASSHLGPAQSVLGDYRRAADLLTESVDRLQGDLIRESMGTTGLLSVFCRMYLACCLAELGEFAAASRYGEEGIRIAETVGHLYSAAFSCYGMGMVLLLQGDIGRSISLLERGLDLCRTSNFPLMSPLVGSALGAAYALAGRPADAIAILEPTEKHAVSIGRKGGHAIVVVRLGEAYLRAGRADDARRSAERALQLSREQKERGHQAYALRLLGEVSSSGDAPDLDGSEAFYRQAIALSEDLGMRPLLARCQLGLGQRHRRAGRPADADRLIATALASFQTLDMPYWLERAEAELAAH